MIIHFVTLDTQMLLPTCGGAHVLYMIGTSLGWTFVIGAQMQVLILGNAGGENAKGIPHILKIFLKFRNILVSTAVSTRSRSGHGDWITKTVNTHVRRAP